MLSAPAATACDCLAAGWCARHQCHKTARWHFLCKNHPKWFAEYEAGRGPSLPGSADQPPRVFEGDEASAAIAPPAQAQPATAEQLPCIFRGQQVREVSCELCGMVGRALPVYACAKHGEVTIGRYKTTRQEPTCLVCADRQEHTHPEPG